MNFTKGELKFLKSLNTPAKVQDYLNSLPFNFEYDGVDTIKSPLRVLREHNAHCFEGAILGAYILSLHKHKSLLMYLKTTKHDFDHVIAPFKIGKYWGALSKTNHNVLRYREPIYKDIRELAMSYFHEYFLDNGDKTLRQYSDILDLSKIKENWAIDKNDLWYIDKALDKMKHFDIVPKEVLKKLRKVDKIEVSASKREEYKKRK
ncbi:MAG: hypothetical protein QG583_645 [Patescibacteria group bacterium]|nr:hypothetical protein [Patescibacteria group bacterium]